MKQKNSSSFLLKDKLWVIFSIIISLVYIANSFSPLRLTNDTVRYFALLETLEGTWPAAFGTSHDFLPYGYVYFLAFLDRLHILAPWVICFFQILYLGGSLFFVKKIFDSSIKSAPLVCFVLLSWTTLKFTITPLSEMQFLFFSTGTIYYYQCFITQRRPIYLMPMLVFCAISIITRTAGIALVAALMISFVISTKKEWLIWVRQHMIATLCTVLALIAILAFIITQPKFITYLSYFGGPFIHDPAAFITRNVRMHLMDWAELFFNIPLSKTAFLMPPFWGGILYFLAGIFFLVFVFRKMFINRKNVPWSVKIYIIVYTLLIFNWPFFEARFWLPLISFIAAIILQKSEDPKFRYSKTELIYACCHVLSGIFVLSYYTNLSFNHEALVNKHDAGKWKQEYEHHFGMKNDADSTTMNRKALYLLEKYDR